MERDIEIAARIQREKIHKEQEGYYLILKRRSKI